MITREDILKKYQTSEKTYSSFTEKAVKKIIPETVPKVVSGIKEIVGKEADYQKKLSIAGKVARNIYLQGKLGFTVAREMVAGVEILARSASELVGVKLPRNEKWEKLLYGREIPTIQKYTKPVEEYIKKEGATEFEKMIIPPVAVLGAIWVESPISPKLKSLFKTIAKTTEKNVIKPTLKQLGIKGTKSEIDDVAGKLATITSEKEVGELLESIPKITEKEIASEYNKITLPKKEVKITPKKVKEFVGEKPAPFIRKRETTLLKERIKKQDIVGKTELKGEIKLTKEKQFATVKLDKTIRQAELKSLRENIKVRATKDRIIKSIKDRAVNIENIKKEIYQFAKEKLPLKTRGKLLAKVSSAKTRGDLAGAFRTIAVERNKIVRKELTGNLEKVVKDIEKLPLKWQDKIMAEMDIVAFKGMSSKTVEKLNKLKSFLEQQPEAKLLFGRKSLKKAEAIKKLEKKTISDIKIKDLIKLHTKISRLVEEGKLIKKTTAGIKELKKEALLKDLQKTSKNIDIEIPRTIGVKLSLKEKLTNKKFQIAKQIQDGYMNYVSADIGFEILDNNVRNGLNMKTFKIPFDDAFLNYKEMNSGIVDNYFDIKKGIEKRHNIKLEKHNMENIMIYATKMQEGGIEKLTNSGIYDLLPKGTKLENFVLTKPEQELYQFMRNVFDELHPHIDNTLQTAHNTKLGKVDNYFSWQTDFNNSDEVFKRLENDYILSSRTAQGFTKARTLGGQVLKLDAEEVFLKHTNDATYFINTEKLLNNLGGLARTNEYYNAVGKNGREWVSGWIDLMARKGIPEGYKPTFVTPLLNNIGAGILGFRLSPIVKQPLAKVTSSALLGKHTFKYDKQFFSQNLSPYIKDISKQQKFRTFDDPAYTELAKNKKLAKWQEWGYLGIKYVDGYTADSVWYASYRKYFADNNLKFSLDDFKQGQSNKKALEYADLITRRTQGSGEAKDMAKMLTSKRREIFRSVLKFQTFVLNESYLIPHDAIGVAIKTEKDYLKAIGIMMAFSMTGIAEDYVSSGMAQLFSSEKYAKQEREKKVSERFLESLITRVPFVNNVFSMFKYGGTGTVITDIPKNIVSGAKSLFQGKKPETKLKGFSRLLETLAGIAGVAGVGQAGQVYRRYGIEETKKAPTSREDILKKYKSGSGATSREQILNKYR